MATESEALSAALNTLRVRLRCPDFAASLHFYSEVLGLRVAMIMPADDPSLAHLAGLGLSLQLERREPGASVASAPVELELSGDLSMLAGAHKGELVAPEGTRIRLTDSASGVAIPPGQPALVVSRADDGAAWVDGRAGMRYRDLIPGRWGGRYVASHIRIDQAGPVADYVHYHQVRFQLIYCRAGWVRVVYQDQGPPFELRAGDCVLQPPQIRHQVLESSAGLEVIELGCPAIHPTHSDPELSLPNGEVAERRYGGQRFARHQAANAQWHSDQSGYVYRDTGIAAATDGLAAVRVLRAQGAKSDSTYAEIDLSHSGDFQFLYLLQGAGRLHGNDDVISLAENDAISLPAEGAFRLQADSGSEWLQVKL